MQAKVKNILRWLQNAFAYRRLLRAELKRRATEPWQNAYYYWLNKYVREERNVCSTCGRTFTFSLRVIDGLCQHDDGRAGATYNPYSTQMSASEYQARSEVLLEHDLSGQIETGGVRTLQQAHQFARAHGWNEHGEKAMVDRTARKLGIRQ